MRDLLVSPEQAAYLASLMTNAREAQQKAADALTLLTLGLVPPGSVLANIDIQTGVLSFSTTPEAPNG